MFHPRGPSLFELVHQALCSTKRGYDLLAPKFDFTPFYTPVAILRHAALVAGERKVERALDLCCGTGAVFDNDGVTHTGLCIGLDFSSGMLAQAQTNTYGDASVSWVQADVLARWPFRGSFDLITCFGALGHIPTDRQSWFLKQIFYSLSPGGRFVFVTAENPRAVEPSFWLAKGFNACLHARNLLWPGEFIMFYMTFSLSRAEHLLKETGFQTDIRYPFSGPFERLALVVAERPSALES